MIFINIGILGGDLRIIFLSKLLIEEGHIVYSYGIEKESEYNQTEKCSSIEEMCNICNIIISSVPFSKDGININSPFSNNKISINKAIRVLQNKTLIAGAINHEIKEKAKELNIEIVDLMDDEQLTVSNIIPTVEGAIYVAMENTKYTIHGSNCLILGYGRIGKLLSKTLKDLGANVSVEARKDSDISWIKVYRYKDIHLDSLSKELDKNRYDIIFNTIPTLILDDKKLKIIKDKNKDTLIIELASNPGGVDYIKANEYNISVIKALGLPGRIAPYSSAKYIKEAIDKILN